MEALFGINPADSQKNYASHLGMDCIFREHPGEGTTAFLQSYALARSLPMRIQKELGITGRPNDRFFQVESTTEETRYFFTPPNGPRADITAEVIAERQFAADGLEQALNRLIEPDVVIDNPEIFYLHRVNDHQDVYFFVN